MTDKPSAPSPREQALEAALRQVVEWSFATGTDLTDAGFTAWAPLIRGPRKPVTREEAVAIINEALAPRTRH